MAHLPLKSVGIALEYNKAGFGPLNVNQEGLGKILWYIKWKMSYADKLSTCVCKIEWIMKIVILLYVFDTIHEHVSD